MLVVDVDVVPEELDVELVVEVVEVDVLLLDVELALVDDDVVLEDAVEVELLMCYSTWLRKRKSKWTSGWWCWWMWSMGVLRMRLCWKEDDVELVVVLLLVVDEVVEQGGTAGRG